MTTEVVGGGDGFVLADPSGSLVGFGTSVAVALTGYLTGTQPFYAIAIDIFRPGTSALAPVRGWGTSPWATLSVLGAAAEVTDTLTASDMGYRTESPVVVYAPVIQEAFQLDARIPLDTAQVGATWGWGTVQLANADRRYDSIVGAWNADGRNVTVYYGEKTWDDNRGLWVDPVTSSLKVLFRGLAQPWSMSETDLMIPLRDGTAWLERPAQRDSYQGTGTYQGDAELAGIPIPKVRGKRLNVPATLIDRVNQIYQFSDAAVVFHQLYEDAGVTITFAGDTTNLYAGITPPGEYRTDKSRGLVQLGSKPVGQITVDLTGSFPLAGSVTTVVGIAKNLLLEDLLVPPALINTAAFDAADAAYPYEAGIFIAPSSNEDGVSAVMRLLDSIYAKLVPCTNSTLSVLVVRAIPLTAVPVAQFGTHNILVQEDGTGGVVPRPLPAGISPPPYRIRVNYAHNETVMTGTLSGVITDAQRQFVEKADRIATWSSGSVALAYRNANDPAPFGGALTTLADAQAVADAVGAFLGARPYQWDVTINVADGIDIGFGDYVWIEYPNHAMENGQMLQVVGRGFDASQDVMTLTVIG